MYVYPDYGTKSCYNCKTGSIVPGHPGDYWTPPEPTFVDCLHFPEDDGTSETRDEKLVAAACQHYDPMVVGKCAECGKQIGIPISEHPESLLADCYYGEPTPVCSEECKALSELKERRAIFKNEICPKSMDYEYECQKCQYHTPAGCAHPENPDRVKGGA